MIFKGRQGIPWKHKTSAHPERSKETWRDSDNQPVPWAKTMPPTIFQVLSWGTRQQARNNYQFSSVQSLSRVRLSATPWIAARQASLSITISQSSLKLTSNESVMPSSRLILCRPLLLLPPIPPSISLFQWVSFSHEVAKVLEFQLQHHWRDKTFLNEQCKEIEENNRMGKARDLFKKTGYSKGNISCKDGQD